MLVNDNGVLVCKEKVKLKWIKPELRDISVPPWALTEYQQLRLRTFHNSAYHLIGFFLLPLNKPYEESKRCDKKRIGANPRKVCNANNQIQRQI